MIDPCPAANTRRIAPGAILPFQEADMRRKGEQKGSVRYRKGSWYITFHEWHADENGNLDYRAVERKVDGVSGAGKQARRTAEQKGYEQHVTKANGVTKVPQGLATLEQFWQARFWPDHVARLKKGGRIHYRTIWTNHVQPSLGATQMREVTPQMIQVLIGAKIDAGKSTQTVTHIRNCLSAIFRHARALRFYEGALPTEGVELPEMTRADRMALTWEQVQMLAGAMPPQYRPLILVLAQTGMRIGEAGALKWHHVNLADEWRIVEGEALPPNSLLVSGSWSRGERTSTKNGSWRKIPLTAEAWVALMQQWEASAFQGEDQPVFCNRVGMPMDAHNVSNRALKKAARKIGAPWISFHTLRHTTSTLADKAGLSVAEKMKVLGHRTADMALHYSHPEMEHVRQAMEQMTGGSIQ